MRGVSRFRMPILPGEASPNAKLTDGQVHELRQLARDGRHSRRDLARRFGISSNRVGQIIRGEAWRHLMPEGSA